MNRLGLRLEKKINTIEHQKKDSECGVYSLNYIISRLHGRTFEDITENIVRDNIMNSNRQKYFRPRK